MRFALLGPVEVRGDEGPVEIRGTRRRTLLAVLLLHRDSAVSADRLGELVWGERPPTSATTSLYNQIMRLRQALGEDSDRIRAVPSGYLMHIEPGELDIDEFQRLCGEARRAAAAADWLTVSERYGQAVRLWRGDFLADVPALRDQAARYQFEEDRLVALHGRVEADLNLGRHVELVGELRTLVAGHPLREVFHSQLMLALHRAGRSADALSAYRELRRATVRELGVEPGLAIRELHQRILRSDPELAPRPDPSAITSAAVDARGGGHRPAALSAISQLPADTRVFTGRERELDEIAELALGAAAGTESGMVVISAISGMGGIGKTALAVRIGHRIAGRFPDGQLFIDLRGYAEDLEPVSAGDALDRLLRSLGVPAQAIPIDLGERAALYRSRLAGTRTLILLDNASSTAQVRPLLPGAPGCLVLVTSRSRLMGLDDAHLLALDTLAPDEAVSLLRKVAGPARVPQDDPGAAELAEQCGRLPLAVRIVASRLRHHRSLTIAELVGELRTAAGRLEHLRDEERDLAGVFASSYADLPAGEQRLLRHLSQIPGPDFDVHTVANLIDEDLRAAERLLESLLEHSLLIQQVPGRYLMHDLVRAFALGLAEEDAEGASLALDRLLAYFQHVTHAAAARLIRVHDPGPPPPDPGPAVVPNLPDRAASLAWARAESANLLAMITYAAERGRAAQSTYLASRLSTHLHQEGLWPQAEQMHRGALELAVSVGDAPGEAEALANLAWVHIKTGRTADAIASYAHALALFRDHGIRSGQARALEGLGAAYSQQGDSPASIAALERALRLFQEVGDRRGEADTLRHLGSEVHMSGDLPAAVALLRRAGEAFNALGDRTGEAVSAGTLGRVQFTMGDMAGAARSTESCVVIFRELESRVNEATALYELSRIRHATGAYEASAELCERSLAVFQDLGHGMGQGNALNGLGLAELALGDVPAALGHLDRALQVFLEIGSTSGQAETFQALADAHLAAGDHSTAAHCLKEALEALGETSRDHVVTQLLHRLGTVAMATGATREALGYYRQAGETAAALGFLVDEARALEGLARCEEELGDRKPAVEHLRTAVEIFERAGAAEAAAAAAYLAELSDRTTDPV